MQSKFEVTKFKVSVKTFALGNKIKNPNILIHSRKISKVNKLI